MTAKFFGAYGNECHRDTLSEKLPLSEPLPLERNIASTKRRSIQVKCFNTGNMELPNTGRDVGVAQNELAAYIREDAQVDWSDAGMPKSPIKEMTPGLEANAYYFGAPGVGAELFQVLSPEQAVPIPLAGCDGLVG
jgi:hypothetical protein